MRNNNDGASITNRCNEIHVLFCGYIDKCTRRLTQDENVGIVVKIFETTTAINTMTPRKNRKSPLVEKFSSLYADERNRL